MPIVWSTRHFMTLHYR